jgi:hypothetical protein
MNRVCGKRLIRFCSDYWNRLMLTKAVQGLEVRIARGRNRMMKK